MRYKITAVSGEVETTLCTIIADDCEGTKSATLSTYRTNDEAIAALPDRQRRALVGLAAFWLLENTELPEDMSLLRAAAHFYREAASHLSLDMDPMTQAAMIRFFLHNGLPQKDAGPNITSCDGSAPATGEPRTGSVIFTGIERAKALKLKGRAS